MARRGARGPRFAAAALALLFAASAARATTTGTATVRVGTCTSSACGQQISIPSAATQFQTPAANLSQEFAWPNEPPFWRSNARAVAGIDMEAGTLYGSVSAFSMEASASSAGNPGTASALVSVEYEDIFLVESDTLSPGALVDVTFDLSFLYRGSIGVTGLGSCCWAFDNYQFSLGGEALSGGGVFPPLPNTYRTGVLAGGVNGDPMRIDLGPVTATAVVGDEFYLRLFLEMDSGVSAKSRWDGDAHRYVPGQAELSGSAALFVSTTVRQAAAGFAAAAAAPGADAYLRSRTGGFVLPGDEVFDPVNLDAHLLPLVSVPEPASILLVGLGAAALAALRRRDRRARRRS